MLTVQTLNLTTSTYMYVLQGKLPLGEALSGLTGLKTIDIREHHISGEDWRLRGFLYGVHAVHTSQYSVYSTVQCVPAVVVWIWVDLE